MIGIDGDVEFGQLALQPRGDGVAEEEVARVLVVDEIRTVRWRRPHARRRLGRGVVARIDPTPRLRSRSFFHCLASCDMWTTAWKPSTEAMTPMERPRLLVLPTATVVLREQFARLA